MQAFNFRLSLNAKFQIPIITGIIVGMVLTIFVMSGEMAKISQQFTKLVNDELENEHKESERIITESLRSKATSLGHFMAKTSKNFILTFDLDALRDLQKEARQDPDVSYALFVKPDKSPFLSGSIPDNTGLYTEQFTITHENNLLGYINIGMSKDIINKKKQHASEHSRKVTLAIQETTDDAVKKLMQRSIFFILLGTTGMTAFIYLVFYKLISKPIHKLSIQAKQIGHGDLIKKIQLDSKDELGDLAETLNTMSESLKESYDKLTLTNTELINATIAKDRFLANMTHELRTPLNAIIGLSDLMLIETDNQSESHDKLSLIYSSGKKLLSIIEQILEITTIQTGKFEIIPVKFDIDPILNELHTSIEKSLSTSGNTFTISVDNNVTDMYSDPVKIKEILANLICNADKFTKHGTIFLTATEETENGISWVLFRVTDTGVGIPKEALDRIFDPFYQADESITRRFGGAGLGLAISQKYCQSLGGDIHVTSKLNIGTEFTVKIPRYVQTETTPINTLELRATSFN